MVLKVAGSDGGEEGGEVRAAATTAAAVAAKDGCCGGGPSERAGLVRRWQLSPQVRKTPSWPRSWANFSLL
jgi:hypothetical protein